MKTPLSPVLQALAQREGFRQKPFEWNYEGLKPLLLHEVLASRRGMSLSLCILFSCVASRLGLALMPVPTTTLGKSLSTASRCLVPLPIMSLAKSLLTFPTSWL
jgi:hypothetical protein